MRFTSSQTDIYAFQQKILSWWERNRRDLPWRNTSDPYAILISEIMLQQTQVSRVVLKYTEFLIHYPTVYALHTAKISDVLRLWRGLGYNSRALRLKDAATHIVTMYNGVFPSEEDALMKLPGVGKYTARAVMVFAFRRHIAVIDTNIRQILEYYFFDGKPQQNALLYALAELLVPTGKSWEWHQALMDFGSLALPRGKREKTKSQSVFKDSNRFYRGRIVDRLRDKSYAEDMLTAELGSLYHKPPSFILRIIQDLENDKLVVRSANNTLQLPD